MTHPIKSERDLRAWVAAAPPGARIEYFRGHLARETYTPGGRNNGLSGARVPREGALGKLAETALVLQTLGLVELTQQRAGPEDYRYFAIARRERVPQQVR